MFDSPEFPQSLDEDLFDEWLEKGRMSPISYEFMLVVWDETAGDYHPLYAESRQDVADKNPGYKTGNVGHSYTIAIYDLYSESKLGPEVFEWTVWCVSLPADRPVFS